MYIRLNSWVWWGLYSVCGILMKYKCTAFVEWEWQYQSTQRKSFPIVTFSAINPTQNGLWLNLDLCDQRLVTHLNYNMALEFMMLRGIPVHWTFKIDVSLLDLWVCLSWQVVLMYSELSQWIGHIHSKLYQCIEFIIFTLSSISHTHDLWSCGYVTELYEWNLWLYQRIDS